VYHLMAQLAQALRSRRLASQVTSQQQFIARWLPMCNRAWWWRDRTGALLCVNNRARQLLELGAQESIVGQRLTGCRPVSRTFFRGDRDRV